MFQTLRRGILNQRVLLEIGSFACVSGGSIRLALHRPDYPTVPFSVVPVMVGTYHIVSKRLSLMLNMRGCQAVKYLLI